MIGPLKITLNAARPGTLPLPPVEAVVGSASTLYIYGAPGVCTSLSVRLFDFDGVASDIAATAAGNCWVVTLPASARYGKITGGLTVIGAGRDETGAAREWILGVGDYWVYNTDGEIDGGEEYTAAAQLAAAAAQTAQGKAEDAQAAAEQAAREAEGAVEHCVPDTRMINGKALSSDINLTASDVGALGNTGDQTIYGFEGTNVELTFGFDSTWPWIRFKYFDGSYATVYGPLSSGVLALLSDIYAAVQQIAPAWARGTTYTADAKVSYNGVVYARKTSGSITSNTNPASDTTNWQAKKVSELFLPLTGGTMTGPLGVDFGNSYWAEIKDNGYTKGLFLNGTPALFITGLDRQLFLGSGNQVVEVPISSGTLALLQNIADNFSTSATYAINNLCVYSGRLYRCTTAITTAEAWTAAHWTEATVEDVLAAIWTALGEIPSWAKSATKPSYTLNEVCPDVENWLGVPGTTAAGKSIKVLAKTVNGVIEGGMTVTGSSNNDNNTTKYRYGGMTVTRNGVATDYLFDGSQSGIARLGNLRYDMPTAVALVAENDEATLVCADKAVTNATIATGFSTLNLTFPTAVTGKVRDFRLRITVAAGESAPALSIPQGITIENPDGAVPEIADGETSAASTTLVYFSETAPNVFTAKAETVKAVA